ncbi:MAG: hypothetical protein HKN88_08990 [Gammaproteobacteria bacterium]|nr:hypothetical protein [Gammaproteobacteria bacterium]NNC98190.1 hypothetical protein [Gammaproteobacteria bacterium]NNM14862.1 hypothetical protein [Gammaproteobacteria bacterium]
MSDKANDKYHEFNAELKELFDKLKQERDELKVKAHLAKAEIGDKWEVAEDKWQTLKDKNTIIAKSVGKAGGDIGEGFKALGAELKNAYKDIRAGIEASKLTK